MERIIEAFKVMIIVIVVAFSLFILGCNYAKESNEHKSNNRVETNNVESTTKID